MQEQQDLQSQDTATQNILVTGAAGTVGIELTKRLLAKGYSVTALYHTAPLRFSHPQLTARQCDILDTSLLEEMMEGITHIYHCAALISYAPEDEKKLYKINVEGTANVVNACLNAGVEKMVHVSSVAALRRLSNKEVTEDLQWTEQTNKSIYGKSKYFGEIEVWRGIGEGLAAAIINPSVILGGDDWSKGSAALFKSAYDEFRYYTTGATGFVDVRDVAQAMILLMNSKISGERFILNAENISYKQLFTMMANCFRKRPPQKKAGSFLSDVAWRAEAFKAFFTNKKRLLTRETAQAAQATVQYDNNKFLQAFPGFSYINIKDSIEYGCNILNKKYQV